MISSSSDLKKLLYSSTSININAGCTVEYNMNNMINNITVTTAATDQNYISGIQSVGTTSQFNSYKKLFPVDSIVKPFRPIRSGVKYYLILPSDLTSAPFDPYTKIEYVTSGKARVYYPGLVNSYKYWVSPIAQAADVTVNYSQSQISIESAYSTGTVNMVDSDGDGISETILDDLADIRKEIFYKTSAPHGLTTNLRVTITGFTNTNFNLTNRPIKRIVSETEFVLEYPTEYHMGIANESGGGARQLQIVNASGTAISTKPALANKILIKFEKTHLIPTSSTVTITYLTGISPGPIVVSSTAYAADGALTLYWNGTTWSTTVPSEPRTYAAPKEIKSIRVVTSAASAERLIGITEISARWEKDLSSDLISFNIQKESSLSEDSLLPVGTITANSAQFNFAKFDQSAIKVLEYDIEDSWATSPEDIIYLYKSAMLFPHFKIIYPQGSITSGSIKYDMVKQGTFYMDTFSVDDYGQFNIVALDGAKYLQEVLPVGLHLQNCPMTSVIACMLDSVGFTNYNFNLSAQNQDNSIPSVVSWWTDQEKTAWDYLQEICRDIQMNAFFDENNILQFYSRDNMYNKSQVDWKFYQGIGSVTIGLDTITAAPSIISFSKNEIPTASQVRVKWAPPISSLYNQEDDQENLWESPATYIYAGPLQTDISATAEPRTIDFRLGKSPGKFPILSTFNFSGYFLLNSEIFEFDAIQYTYRALSDNQQKVEWITSKTELDAIRSISDQDIDTFRPTGKYRIKDRGLFGTKRSAHQRVTANTNTNWIRYNATWDAI